VELEHGTHDPETNVTGNAQALKQMEMVETSLLKNAKVVITGHGIGPTLLLGSQPVSVSSDRNGAGFKSGK
jgi:hypothetical protein